MRKWAVGALSIAPIALKRGDEQRGSISALVQTPTGSVVKVKAGQYVGINNGKVTRVDDNYLLINETLPDGLGCWNQRNVKLALK